MNEDNAIGPTTRARRDQSVDAGLSFLVSTQEPSGSWDLSCRVDGSEPTTANGLFSTTAVLLAVGQLLPEDTVQRAIDFIISCRNPSGNWFFDASLGVPDDADDTACALAAVARFRPAAISASDVDYLLEYWRGPDGPFRTWHPASDEIAEFWSFPSTDDAIVNCNVILALTELGFTCPREMLVAVEDLVRATTSTRYYCGVAPIAHAAARVGVLDALNDDVRILQPTESWNSLQLSNWMSARPAEAPNFTSHLLAFQQSDGGWPDDDWCTGNIVPPTVWGSRSASTAFALEALVGMTLVNQRSESSRA